METNVHFTQLQLEPSQIQCEPMRDVLSVLHVFCASCTTCLPLEASWFILCGLEPNQNGLNCTISHLYGMNLDFTFCSSFFSSSLVSV